jgi:hypothetical protein
MSKQSRGRFSVEKLRKRLLSSGPGAFSTPREAEQKSFLVTFFQKSNSFLVFQK